MNNAPFNLGDTIRRMRIERNLALKDVAASSGFSKALISRIEHNLVSPPLATLYRISQVLNVRMKDFFESEPPREELRVVRASERAKAFRDGSRYGYRYETLADDPEAGGFEPLLVTLSDETKDRPHHFAHPGHEFIYIVKGRMRLNYGSQEIVLDTGDSVFFNARVPHSGVHHGKRPVTALSIRITDPLESRA
jgi:transcriptional regulator with XRE-family HTH domain